MGVMSGFQKSAPTFILFTWYYQDTRDAFMLNNAQTAAAMQADINTLRERFPRTADLYREACAVMFFRYGLTPTTNAL
jgi:hypothetical protein